MACEFDAIDQDILDSRMAARERIDRPRIGDFVLFPTGELERFSHDWDDGLQTSFSGSFYLCTNGQGSFSGSLNPITPLEKLELTDKLLSGTFWFFHHDFSGAGRGVYFTIPCRVYKTTAAYEGYGNNGSQSRAVEALKRQLDAQHLPGTASSLFNGIRQLMDQHK